MKGVIALLIVLLIGFAIVGLPRFVRTWYLSWFDEEAFRESERQRVEELQAERPANLSDQSERWARQLTSPGWLWYNRLMTTIGLLLFLIGVAAVLINIL